jgi:hypothetical protein
MHPTTALYLAQSHVRDLEAEAARARLAAAASRSEPEGGRPAKRRITALVLGFRRVHAAAGA